MANYKVQNRDSITLAGRTMLLPLGAILVTLSLPLNTSTTITAFQRNESDYVISVSFHLLGVIIDHDAQGFKNEIFAHDTASSAGGVIKWTGFTEKFIGRTEFPIDDNSTSGVGDYLNFKGAGANEHVLAYGYETP